MTTFYPLWAGIATARQAARRAAQSSPVRAPGGLQTSTNKSGSQWDAPFGWAPMQMIAVKVCGATATSGGRPHHDELPLHVVKDFREHNTIVEKYDVERRESEIAAESNSGTTTNVIGFGWTNAAFTELYAELPEREKPDVLKLDGMKVPGKQGED